jgi:hypothetical protein
MNWEKDMIYVLKKTDNGNKPLKATVHLAVNLALKYIKKYFNKSFKLNVNLPHIMCINLNQTLLINKLLLTST